MSFNDLFSNLSSSDTTISITSFMMCIIVALALGLIIAYAYSLQSKHTKSFVITLAMLPCVVAVIIMMVNGSIGTGVAVAGAFSLVRFRSVPGSAKEIGSIFVAMGSGLAIGMGYLGIAILFVLIITAFTYVLTNLHFGETKQTLKTLTITIPEDLNYTNIFDDIFKKYTNSIQLNFVKTTNMGSLFKLSYDLELKDSNSEKEFIDELRCRNGNLEIRITQQSSSTNEL